MDSQIPSVGLENVGLFAHLDAPARSAITARFERISIERGEILMREGDPGDALYVVVSGRFSVTRADLCRPIPDIGAGQPIGEIGFLTGTPRTATVTALRDGVLLKLDRAHLIALAETHPGIWRALSTNLAERLAATTGLPARPVPPRPRTIAIIAAGGSPLEEGVLDRLVRAFSDMGDTLVMAGGRRQLSLPDDCDLSDALVTERINALETTHDFVLLVADPTPTEWSEKAIHHADLVLAIGRHAADPSPNPVEVLATRLVAPSARRLVLVHETRRKPSGTRYWLATRSLAMHHHVALDDPEDFARVVRFVSGNALGLVLAGGGALCAAHVGVYKALLESGYSFDIMGGTSGGSAMAGAFLLRSTPEDIDRDVHEMFVANGAMRRYTLPRYSLLDHTHFDYELKRLYGHIDIEDLWLPFFALSTNLSRYGPHLERTGQLWKAVRASASIPCLLPPVYTPEGEMLVDGSLIDNVPVAAMHDLKTGPNIVIAFEPRGVERFDIAYDSLPSRSELVRLAMTPWGRERLPGAPGLASVLMRSLMANRHAFHESLTGDDLLLLPPTPSGIGFLDWHRHRELFEEGYRWGRARLPAHPPTGSQHTGISDES